MTVRILIFAVLVLLMAGAALAAPPEISHIHPDFAGMHQRVRDYHTHHVITGEGFIPDKLEFWGWRADGDIEEAIGRPDFDSLQLPAAPPAGARRISPIDVEEQVAVASLHQNNMATFTVIWASNGDGFSRPYLMHAAKPFWISRPEAHAGDILYMFGFGLRTPGPVQGGRNCFVALRGTERVIMARPVKEARSARHTDSHLVHFELPQDVPDGDYTVYVHNGQGGAWGWRKAGDLKVSPRPAPKREFNARDFGATGQGIDCDLYGLQAAVNAAAIAGGGRVLLPPGTYRISETLRVPAGVELIGAGPDNTIIEGFRYDPFQAMEAWWAQTSVAASVVVLESDTRLESLTVGGAVSKGSGGYGTVAAASARGAVPANIVVKGCRIKSIDEDAEDGRYRYRAALLLPGNHHSIIDNDITGSLEMRPHTRRSEIISNTFRAGYALDECSLMLRGSELLVDANRLQDASGRLVLYPVTHSYVRYNEVLNYGVRSGWANVPEPFLLHGGGGKSMGSPTASGPAFLTDSKQNWQENEYAGATALISHGRGKGQYRFVRGNSADTLHLFEPWRVQPDETSEYSVGTYFTENALFGNQNHTPGRLSLWLDCIANLVEMHRDHQSGGIDIWGQDRSRVDSEGKGSNLHRFHPSWYNYLRDNWLDGCSLRLFPGVAENNAWRGIPLFANTMLNNKARQPHMEKSPNTAHFTRVGGLVVAGGQGRVGASHTIVAGNQVSNTTAGVVMDGQADKTFVINNLFHAVDNPVMDEGAGTLLKGNVEEKITAGRRVRSVLPESRNEKRFEPFIPPKLAEPFTTRSRTGGAEAGWISSRIAHRSFDPGAVGSDEARQACADNLKRLYGMLQSYERANGRLPEAVFYPSQGQDESISLAALLGPAAAHLLLCPAENRLENIHYLWNSSLGGRSLESIADPAGTWMLVDMSATHSWLLSNRFAGHQGGVNALFADGSVRHLNPQEAGALLASSVLDD